MENYKHSIDLLSINKYSKLVQTAPNTTDCLAPVRTCIYTSKLQRTSKNCQTFPKYTTESFDELNVIKETILAKKLQMLAEKVIKPDGERKIRKKIKNYLKRVPSHFLNDGKKRQFREKIPDIIIKKLKKFYLKADACKSLSSINVFRVEIPKDHGHIATEVILRSLIKRWVEILPLNKRDILGKTVRRDDIFKYTLSKLKSIVANRPESEKLYRQTLKWNITEILKDLPIISDSFDKRFYVNKFTNALQEQILNIEGKCSNAVCESNYYFSNSYLSANFNIFVVDGIKKFLERTHLNVDIKEKKSLEKKIIRIFNNTELSHKDVREEISEVLQKVGKVPQYQAKRFSNELHNDVIFKGQTPVTINKNSITQTLIDSFTKMSNSLESCTISQNAGIKFDDNTENNVETYRNQLIEKINEWLTNLDIQIPTSHNSMLKNIVIKELADDIINRWKTLQRNPVKIDKEYELQHIQFQIFKWINKNIGEIDKESLEHATELIEKLQAIPVPKFGNPHLELAKNLSYILQMNRIEREIVEVQPKPYDERLVEEIFEWLHELPVDLHSSESVSLKTNLVRDLAESIEKGLKAKRDPDELINAEVDTWVKHVLRKHPQKSVIDSLKYKIKAVSFTEEDDINYKQERFSIRRYEDIIDEWIDNIPLEPRNEKFVNTRNELVHELAVKMCAMKNMIRGSEDNNKKLQNYVSVWLKKLPLYPGMDKKAFREEYSVKLVRLLQEYNLEESLPIQEKLDDPEFVTVQIEGAILDWLQSLPLYRNNNIIAKNKLENITRNFAKEFNLAMQGNTTVDPDSVLLQYIKILCSDTNEREDFIQNVAFQLKLHLIKLNMFGDISQRDVITGDILDSNIVVWLQELPLNVYDRDIIERKRKAFLGNLKLMRASGVDENTIKEEIIIFVKSLPIDMDILTSQFVDNEANRLLDFLRIIPIEDMPRKGPPKSSDIVRDAILDWSKHLPMLPVYCPTNFKSLINEMATNVTKLIVHPEHSLQEDNEEQMQIEIGKYLGRFPLRSDVGVNDIAIIISNLLMILKDIKLYRDDDNNNSGNRDYRPNTSSFIIQNNVANNLIINPNAHESEGPSSNLSDDKTKHANKKTTIRTFANGVSKKETDTKSNNVNLDGSDFLDMAGERQHITNPYGFNDLPEGMTLGQLYEHFIKVFTEACQQIPIDPSAEDQIVAKNAPLIINNGIWKMVLTMIANPKIANDYVYFEFLLEERLDDMLDILSQTEELVQFRYAWKCKVVAEALKMLKYYQSLTDAPSFRRKIIAGSNRDFLINDYQKMDYKQQYLDTCKLADNFIMLTKYKEEDPIKAHVYRQRLINEIEELINQIKQAGNIEYCKINRDFLVAKVIDILKDVPIPNERILREEADEILLGNEIEQWYKELHVTPIIDVSDAILRQRARILLAKKIMDIENKMLSVEDSAYERDIKHEVSIFLENNELQEGDDLNKNIIVEELANRLKNRRENKNIGYKTFEQEKPTSSSFAQRNPDILAPLLNIEVNNLLQAPKEPKIQQTPVHIGMQANDLPPNTVMINPIAQVECSSNKVGTTGHIAPNRKSYLSVSYPYQTNQRSQLSKTFPQSQSLYPYNPGTRFEQQIRVPQYSPSEHFQVNSGSQEIQIQQIPVEIGIQANTLPQNTVMINPIKQVENSSNEVGTRIQIQPTPRTHLSATYPNLGNQLADVDTRQNIPSRRSQFSQSFPQSQYLHPNYPGVRFEQQTRVPKYSSDRGSQDVKESQITAGSQGITGSQVSPRGATATTARVVTEVDQERVEEDDILEDEVDSEGPTFKCKCMNRILRCRKPCPALRNRRRPRCIPMPCPYRYFY